MTNNLTKTQREELKSLRDDKSLVIQNADKGGAIVLLDRSLYDQEAKRQLANTTFYKKLDHNPTSEVKLDIHSRLKALLEQGTITKAEHKYMTVDFPITPVFYILPKIHKNFTDLPPGRPIIAAIGSLTEKISAFVDYFLQPLTTALPSYTRDSMDFIKVIKSIGQVEETNY